jgi:eukaryotic-like serine/threonine-protein kinase
LVWPAGLARFSPETHRNMPPVPASAPQGPRVVGRYALFDEIASGGMASVHVGRLVGPVGFSRTVAIKRLHPQFAKDPEFVTMFLDEARLAARIRHPNVVPTLDVVASQGELFLVMEFVLGASFARLLQVTRSRDQRAPPEVVASIMSAVLHGLHAAHEAKSERGEPLGIVHRDVSPQNILVGTDGIARVLDFGIAKAAGRAQVTREGHVRGKMAYISPEQFQHGVADRKADIYATAVVMWEALTGQRLFLGENEAATIAKVLTGQVPVPSSLAPGIPKELDEVVLRGLSRDPAERFETAREMALTIEGVGLLSAPSRVGSWVEDMVGGELATRALTLTEIEQIDDLPIAEHSSRPPRILVASDEPTTVEPGMGTPPLDMSAGPSRSEEPTAPDYRPQRRRRMIAGGLAAALVLLLFFGWLGLRRGAEVDASSGAAAHPIEAAESPVPPPPEPSSLAAPTAPAPPADTVSEPAPPDAPATGPAPSIAPPEPSGRRGPVRRPSGRPHAKETCNPPYTIDQEGHRRYKLECL